MLCLTRGGFVREPVRTRRHDQVLRALLVDPAELRELIDREVRASQRRRRTVVDALGRGAVTSWDYAPPYDAARRYIRNHTALGELEAGARYPSVAPRPTEASPEP